MAAGDATLVAWSLVGDLLWLRPTAQGLQAEGCAQARRGEEWLEQELARVKQHIAEQGLKIVRTPEDVDRALKGEPHVVLAIEGASFVDDGAGQIKAAYDAGVRHVQLVHYIKNTIGDFQTEKPTHNGLSAFGKAAVEECNRLGMLIDLAHCTGDAVTQALALSKAPMVWSHSSVTPTGKPHWSMPIGKARQLTLEQAKAIAGKGGVVGLWALRSDVGGTPETYADRLSEMADWLGEDHVGVRHGHERARRAGDRRLRGPAAGGEPVGAQAGERGPHPQDRDRELRARAQAGAGAGGGVGGLRPAHPDLCLTLSRPLIDCDQARPFSNAH